MACWELVQDNVSAAERVLAELPDPPQVLVDQVADRRDELAQEAARMAQLAKDRDWNVGWRTRLFVVGLAGGAGAHAAGLRLDGAGFVDVGHLPRRPLVLRLADGTSARVDLEHVRPGDAVLVR